MAKYTLQQRIYLYDMYVRYKAYPKCQMKFKRKFSGTRIPSKPMIQKVVTKVRATGSVLDRRKRPKPRVLTKEKLVAIAAHLDYSPRKSLSQMAQEMGVSKSTFRRAVIKIRKRNKEVRAVPYTLISYFHICTICKYVYVISVLLRCLRSYNPLIVKWRLNSSPRLHPSFS
jgi:hypothetical protein